MDFQDNLIRMRDAFKNKKAAFSDLLNRKPLWVENHEINRQYIDQNYLLKSGEVYYASLVQANVAIFKPGINNYGAVIIIGVDAAFDKDPMRLRKVAQNFFKYKDVDINYVPANVAEFARLVSDERKYVFNVPIPLALTSGSEALFTTLIIDRHHLPKRRLVSGFFPVIAAPGKVKSCMVLPRRFWTEEMKALFLGKRV